MSKKKPEVQSAGGDEPSFEKALDRLETIVAEMEGGTLSLEDMMVRFEEGQSLVKVCAGKLNQVERRIEILVKEGESVVAKPFGEDAGAGAAAEDGKDAADAGGMPF
jgi:exodeoxyribonuclease VII small subunit